jgi:hypothetical protein
MSAGEVVEDKVRQILFPEAARRLQAVREHGRRFVHYTSAEVAVSIIRNARVWMRNATTMNDFMEVEHGLFVLARAYNGDPGKSVFRPAIDAVFPGSSDWLKEFFNSWQPSLKTETYLTCVSEHHDDEDTLGRLSMWRAYGGRSGVALVLRPDAFQLNSHALNAYSSPVIYPTQSEFDTLFLEVAGNIVRERDFLQSLGKELFQQTLFNMCRYAALCTKHPGFKEEKEWRVVHSPAIHPSKRLETSVETVRGTTQRVYKIPLEDVPEEGLVGLKIPALLDRIIIGPTDHPHIMADAFRDLLRSAGVEDAHDKVWVSDIPLRQP